MSPFCRESRREALFEEAFEEEECCSWGVWSAGLPWVL